ncbi:MAG: T9SS type A sorting domain-containing protein, partial [Bacteroidota bacterium]
FSQKLNANGQIQWQSAGIVVSSAIEIQSHPKNIPDGSGGSIFVWQDKRANQYDIYCHHLNYAGIGNYTLSEDDFKFSLFPNPTKGFVQVQSSHDLYNLRVYNMFGEILMVSRVSNFSKGIDFSSFAAGIYIVELDGGRGKIRSQLIKI